MTLHVVLLVSLGIHFGYGHFSPFLLLFFLKPCTLCRSHEQQEEGPELLLLQVISRSLASDQQVTIYKEKSLTEAVFFSCCKAPGVLVAIISYWMCR